MSTFFWALLPETYLNTYEHKFSFQLFSHVPYCSMQFSQVFHPFSRVPYSRSPRVPYCFRQVFQPFSRVPYCSRQFPQPFSRVPYCSTVPAVLTCSLLQFSQVFHVFPTVLGRFSSRSLLFQAVFTGFPAVFTCSLLFYAAFTGFPAVLTCSLLF